MHSEIVHLNRNDIHARVQAPCQIMCIEQREPWIEAHRPELHEFAVDKQLIAGVGEQMELCGSHPPGNLERPPEQAVEVAPETLAVIPNVAGGLIRGRLRSGPDGNDFSADIVFNRLGSRFPILPNSPGKAPSASLYRDVLLIPGYCIGMMSIPDSRFNSRSKPCLLAPEVPLSVFSLR